MKKTTLIQNLINARAQQTAKELNKMNIKQLSELAKAQRAQAQAQKQAEDKAQAEAKEEARKQAEKTEEQKQAEQKQAEKPAEQKPAEKKSFTPHIKDGKMCLQLPKISATPYVFTFNGQPAPVTGYTLNFDALETAGAKNSNISDALAIDLQNAIVAHTLQNVESTRNNIMRKLETKDGEEIVISDLDKERARYQLVSLQGISAELKKLYPLADGYKAGKHAELLTCAITGAGIPAEFASWVSFARKAVKTLDGAMVKLIAGEQGKLTEEERETVTALKRETEHVFSAYCEETPHNRKFNLRVKDADILQWYKQSGAGYAGERGKYAFRSTLDGKNAGKAWSARLTKWFMGAILRDYEEKAE